MDYPVTAETIAAAKAAQLQERVNIVMYEPCAVIDGDGDVTLHRNGHLPYEWCPNCGETPTLITANGIAARNAYRCESCGTVFSAMTSYPGGPAFVDGDLL